MLKSSLKYLLTVACAMSMSTIVVAQVTTGPSSSAPSTGSGSSHANRELSSIRNEDVGDGYSVSSLNSISLQNARAQVGYNGRTTSAYSAGASRAPSVASGGSKPFSSITTSPTVSPYLNLFRDDFDGGGDFNYQTLVRPQFQQMATNQQFQRQNTELSQRVQSISAQGAFQNPAGSENLYPTGHSTAFGYYGRYYPGMPQPPRGR